MGFLLHHYLTETAQRMPEALALQDGDTNLDYAELDARSNRIAHALIDLGVRPGQCVGLYLAKSAAAIAAAYGIVKAGAAYVPMDPAAPVQRLSAIATSCELSVIVSEGSRRAEVDRLRQPGTLRRVLWLGERTEPLDLDANLQQADVDGTLDTAPAVRGIETDLAYVLYTSGSTGRPKGVMIDHRASRAFVDWAGRTLQLRGDDRVTSHAPLHFDLSTFDLYASAQAGSAVVLVPEGTSAFPIKLVQLLQREAITCAYLVPSILALMARYGKLERHDLSKLRLLLFAGEVFPIKYLRQWKEQLPHTDFYNLYGPTETNVCTYYRVPATLDPALDRPVPIGRMCDNAAAIVVDDRGERVTAPGARGELWVRGPCVARGYYGNPTATAAGFVSVDGPGGSTEPAYRTGDIVEILPDGETFDYVGRNDHMVKTRGYRVELGEIEAALLAHADVEAAVVVPVPDELLGNRLVAVLGTHRALTKAELDEHCQQRLPRYMVPERYERLAALPTTSSGKIDRLALARQMADA